MTSMQIGVDLAKSVFEVAGSTVPGQVQERRRLSRAAFGLFFAQRPPPRSSWRPAARPITGAANSRAWATASRCCIRDGAHHRDGNKSDRADAKARHPRSPRGRDQRRSVLHIRACRGV
jgi:hypothetical protein